MKPALNQEHAQEASSLQLTATAEQDGGKQIKQGRKTRTSAAMLGLALSVGASGTLLSSASEALAVDRSQVATFSALGKSPRVLPSIGSSRPSGASAIYHTVADGETLWDIAAAHRVDVEELREANGIAEDMVIRVGQVLKVPAKAQPQATDLTVASRLPMALEDRTPQFSTATPSVQRNLSQNAREDATVEGLSQVAILEAAESPQEEIVLTDEQSITAGVKPSLSLEQQSKALESAVTDEAAIEQRVALRDSSSPFQSREKPRETYQVRPGDTIWSIARQQGIAPAALIEANGLDSAARIFPGNTLVLPKAESARDGVELTEDSEAPLQVATLGEYRSLRSTPSEASSTETADSEDAPSAIAAEELASPAEQDLYVQNLLSKVRSSQAAAETAIFEDAATVAGLPAGSDEAPLQIAADSTAADEANLSASAPVNPQFAPASSSPTDAIAPDRESLLAAAPLGSEVYAPISETPEGRVVSPNMPILPDSDQYLPEAPNRFSGYMWPAQGVLTSGFGRRWGRMHQGIDIAGPVGTPIYAAAAGVVVRSGWNSGGYGNLVDIRHPDGSLTRYAHNSRLLVHEGQQVRQGQQIAEMGSTGYSTGPHLHFEIRLPDQGAVNPMAYLPGR